MSDSLLTTVQDFCAENALPVPTAVMGVTLSDVVQYRAIMKRLVTELSQYSWTQQQIRKTFTTIAAQDQGALTSLIGADYRGIIQSSIWNETLRRPLIGPVTPASWEAQQALPVTGPIYQYRIEGNRFKILPAPPAGHVIGLIYQSSYGVTDSTGTTAKATFTNDTDLIVFPDVVVAKGLDYMWKKKKGEDWSDLYAEYMSLIAKNIIKDTAPILYMDQPNQNIRPGIWVPAGNWGV
jgi:hypothetical protein